MTPVRIPSIGPLASGRSSWDRRSSVASGLPLCSQWAVYAMLLIRATLAVVTSDTTKHWIQIVSSARTTRRARRQPATPGSRRRTVLVRQSGQVINGRA